VSLIFSIKVITDIVCFCHEGKTVKSSLNQISRGPLGNRTGKVVNRMKIMRLKTLGNSGIFTRSRLRIRQKH
jgi:hypothetical protein